jgi:hypothetical protein
LEGQQTAVCRIIVGADCNLVADCYISSDIKIAAVTKGKQRISIPVTCVEEVEEGEVAAINKNICTDR